MQLHLGYNSMTSVGKILRIHIHEASHLVEASRSDAVALLNILYLLGDRLHAQLVDRLQWEVLPRTANTNGLMVRSDLGLCVRLSPGNVVRC